MAGRVDARLFELGIELPQPAASVANYVPYVISGNLVFVSGQITFVQGKVQFVGKVGADLSTARGQEAARVCGLNIIAQLKAACAGDLDRVVRIIKLGGFINSAPQFMEQPAVMNGASDLMVDVFGDKGRHTRTGVSAVALPFGAACQIDAVVEIA
jgi:enamine deaminase RidA (YjgF/YER057c/UK114 family)